MNQLTIVNFNGTETVDSRQVAEVLGKPHNDLMKSIHRYIGFLNKGEISPVDFFIESDYTDGKGETRPCYLLTRKGCEMVANKMTGQKGTVFTALYINAFHDMEKLVCVKDDERQARRLDIQEMDARVRMSKAFASLADAETQLEEYREMLLFYACAVLCRGLDGVFDGERH